MEFSKIKMAKLLTIGAIGAICNPEMHGCLNEADLTDVKRAGDPTRASLRR